VAAKAGCNRPEMLEFREEPLDQISHFVALRAEGGWIVTNTERADVGERALFSQLGADGVTVVGAISEQNRAFTNPTHHCLEGLAVMGLAGRQFQRDRQAVAVDDGMDFGRIPAAGTAHAIAEPPFLSPLAPCWWTRTEVESIICTRPS